MGLWNSSRHGIACAFFELRSKMKVEVEGAHILRRNLFYLTIRHKQEDQKNTWLLAIWSDPDGYNIISEKFAIISYLI